MPHRVKVVLPTTKGAQIDVSTPEGRHAMANVLKRRRLQSFVKRTKIPKFQKTANVQKQPQPLSIAGALQTLFSVQGSTIDGLVSHVKELTVGADRHGYDSYNLSLSDAEYDNLRRRHKRIGAGSYGEILECNGTAVKLLCVKSNDSELEQTRQFSGVLFELVIQQLLVTWWGNVSSLGYWTPTHHPFPTLYDWASGTHGICKVHKSTTEYNFAFKMFKFDEIKHPTSKRNLEIVLQLCAVLGFNADGVPLQCNFMHLDLHMQNIMVRGNSKTRSIILNEQSRPISRIGDVGVRVACGKEVSMIDFGMAWLQCGTEVVFAPGSVYGGSVEYNKQHDMRMYIVDAYAKYCIDDEFNERVHTSNFSEFVTSVVHEARDKGDARFQLSTNLPLLKTLTLALRKLQSQREETTFGAVLSTPDVFEELVVIIRSEYPGFGRRDAYEFFTTGGNKTSWDNVWSGATPFPYLTHFQYAYTINNFSTPIFDPVALFDVALKHLPT